VPAKRKQKKRKKNSASFFQKVFLAMKHFGALLKRLLKSFGLFLKHVGLFLQRAGLFLKRFLKSFGLFLKRVGAFLKRVGLFFKRVFIVIKPVLPTLFGGALVFAGLYYTGLERTLTDDLSLAIGFFPAVLLVALISFIPFFSPLLGPGLLIALLAGLLTGEQLAAGRINPFMLLPALFAIDVQIGNRFIPRSFALGETEPETLDAGVPGIFFTRLITVPAAVTAAYFFSFVVFK